MVNNCEAELTSTLCFTCSVIIKNVNLWKNKFGALESFSISSDSLKAALRYGYPLYLLNLPRIAVFLLKSANTACQCVFDHYLHVNFQSDLRTVKLPKPLVRGQFQPFVRIMRVSQTSSAISFLISILGWPIAHISRGNVYLAWVCIFMN